MLGAKAAPILVGRELEGMLQEGLAPESEEKPKTEAQIEAPRNQTQRNAEAAPVQTEGGEQECKWLEEAALRMRWIRPQAGSHPRKHLRSS